jgi:hypothetical protein
MEHDINALVDLATIHKAKWGDSCHHALGAEVVRLRKSEGVLLAQLKRILAMHDCKNNGAYNGEAMLSESVADEIRTVITRVVV